MSTISGFVGDAQDLHLDREGNLAVVDGLEEVRQAVVERLQTALGEWFLDTRLGVPYRQEILERPVDVDIVSAVMDNMILGVEGVDRVSGSTARLDSATRRLVYATTVHSSFGQVQIEQEV